jgi:hypothetical protein
MCAYLLFWSREFLPDELPRASHTRMYETDFVQCSIHVAARLFLDRAEEIKAAMAIAVGLGGSVPATRSERHA